MLRKIIFLIFSFLIICLFFIAPKYVLPVYAQSCTTSEGSSCSSVSGGTCYDWYGLTCFYDGMTCITPPAGGDSCANNAALNRCQNTTGPKGTKYDSCQTLYSGDGQANWCCYNPPPTPTSAPTPTPIPPTPTNTPVPPTPTPTSVPPTATPIPPTATPTPIPPTPISI